MPVLGETEDRLLCLVEELVGVSVRAEGGGEDALAGPDQLAQHRLFPDDASVVLHVGRAGHALDQGGQIGRSAAFLQRALSGEGVLQRHEIDGGAVLDQLGEGVEDFLVASGVERGFAQQFLCPVERPVVDENRAQYGTLRFIGMGQCAG